MRDSFSLFFLLSFQCVFLGPSASPNAARHPLPVLWVMPVNQDSGPGPRPSTTAVSILPAVQLALDDLSRQPPPLGNYLLDFHLVDSQCDTASGLKALFDAMWEGPKYLMVFGGVCPSATMVMAESMSALSLVQLSFSATAPVLSDRTRYPNFLRTIPSNRGMANAVLRVLERLAWTRVGLLYHRQHSFTEKELTKALTRAGVELAVSQSLSANGCSDVQMLKDNDVRIIIGLFDDDSAHDVFCCAYRTGLFGERYQWLLLRESSRRWWEEGGLAGCSPEHLQAAVEGALRLQTRHLSDSADRGISGRTPAEYEQAYHRALPEGQTASSVHGFAYDGVWVMAGALTRVMDTVRQRERARPQGNASSVSQQEVVRMLLRAVKDTHFEGVTGNVSFHNGERVGRIKVTQIQEGRETLLGQYDSDSEELELQQLLLRFPGGGPARDRASVVLQRRSISLVLYSSLGLITVLPMLCAVGALCYNTHRERPSDAVPLDGLLLLGSVLSSASLLLLGLDGSLVVGPQLHLLCSVRLWLLSLGHTLVYGGLLARSWKVYRAVKMEKSGVGHRQPALLVGGLLLLDVGLLTAWQLLDPLTHSVSMLQPQMLEGVWVQRVMDQCDCSVPAVWLAVGYGYRAPLMVLGCLLAWRIRTERILLASSMFTVTALSGTSIWAFYLTQDQPDLRFILLVLLVWSCSAVTMLLVLLVYKIEDTQTSPARSQQYTGPQLCQEERQKEDEEEKEHEEEEGEEDVFLSRDCQHDSAGLLENLRMENRHLRRTINQLDTEWEAVAAALYEEPAAPSPPSSADALFKMASSRRAGEYPSLMRRPSKMTCEAQLCSSDGNGAGDGRRSNRRSEDINSPEHVQRRLSLQLPILHHAYHPGVGGVTASCSSLLGNTENGFMFSSTHK